MIDTRRMREEDVPAALEFFRELEETEATAASVAQFLRAPNCHAILAFDEGRVVGWLRAYALPDYDLEGPKMLLYEIDVLERHRRRGIGRAMVEALKALARERACQSVWVITEDDNLPARRLYESAGLRCRDVPDRVYLTEL